MSAHGELSISLTLLYCRSILRLSHYRYSLYHLRLSELYLNTVGNIKKRNEYSAFHRKMGFKNDTTEKYIAIKTVFNYQVPFYITGNIDESLTKINLYNLEIKQNIYILYEFRTTNTI